jgi:hypothetical protein
MRLAMTSLINRSLLALIMSVAMAASVRAAQPEAECVPYDSAYESAPLFRVKAAAGQPRVYLYKQTKRCPGDQPCASRQKAYLVDGDVVFAGPESEGFHCSYYGTPKGKIIAGFIPDENLTPESGDTSLTAEFVEGTWRFEDDSIAIKAAGPGKVEAEGNAIYQTSMTENDGAFTATASVPAPSELVFRDGEGDAMCEVRLHRRGPYLVASDNSQCGGMNVRFNGIYTKAPGK